MLTPTIITPNQLIELYDVSRSQVYRWMKERKFTYHKLEKKIWIEAESFEAFVKSHKVSSQTELTQQALNHKRKS